MLSTLFSFVQLLLFLSLWSLLFYSSFLVLRSLSVARFPAHPLLHLFIPSIVVCSLLFELIHRWESLVSSPSCSSFLIFVVSCQHQSLWSLNPFQVVASLIGDVIVLVASVMGRSCSTFVSSFFRDLPWLLSIPSFFLVTFLLVLSVLSLQGYQLSLGWIFITVKPTPRRDSAPNYANETKKPPVYAPIIKKIDELYLKMAR
ncbi:hypothetical protein PFISCL1PPCAC_23420 [Pristionchus fissidentatus]|uniref:G protein-coupled receptor n=1 Tax=Pristionchus fissidentatus TaxID=1538716 RepID=A0AAV5WNB9_9BILA|nr:hypothetical protein PFISCL1PPCAC_23420 [Pristionchus fissidentatus]